jgi:hypothetical protein
MKFTLIFKVPTSAGQLPVPLAASMDDEKDANGELEVSGLEFRVSGLGYGILV